MAWTYCVTFRIADKVVNGKSYSERYEAFMDDVRAEKGGFWAETTSFMFVESSLLTPDFSKRIVKNLSAQHDTVVVFDPEDMSACYFGQVDSSDVLTSFLPKAVSIG